MTLQQLRFLTAIVESDFNITAAAAKLNATQPAVSRQLLLLEQELGFQIFSRNGRGLSRVTEAGLQVIEHARRALRETQNIKNVSAELSDPLQGELRVGSTHTEAHYVLPQVIQQFREQFPRVRLSLHPGEAAQVAEMVRVNRVDLVMATGPHHSFDGIAVLPCYRATRRIVVPPAHPLAGSQKPSLAMLGAYPIASQVSAPGERPLQDVFTAAGITPQIVLTSRDAELIKTYVRHGLGIGIIADVAFDAEKDQDLTALNASHLFPEETTWAGFSKQGVLRRYMYEFLGLLAPGLTRENIDRARDAAHAV
jgi:LysR family cys regulon transcriptional activator